MMLCYAALPTDQKALALSLTLLGDPDPSLFIIEQNVPYIHSPTDLVGIYIPASHLRHAYFALLITTARRTGVVRVPRRTGIGVGGAGVPERKEEVVKTMWKGEKGSTTRKKGKENKEEERGVGEWGWGL
jgi:hypothetical protein